MSDMTSKIGELLFKVARSRLAGYFIGFSFQYLSFLIPVQRVLENKHVLAFYHPKPFWETHLLVVPKQIVPALISMDADDPKQVELLQQILIAAEQTAMLCELETCSILVNGGKYQDVPQLHFHVAAGKDRDGNLFALRDQNETKAKAEKHWVVYHMPEVNGRYRTLFIAQESFEFETGSAEISELFQLVQQSVSTVKFVGFSVRIVLDLYRPSGSEEKMVAILAGELWT